jgi:hypothetical protein
MGRRRRMTREAMTKIGCDRAPLSSPSQCDGEVAAKPTEGPRGSAEGPRLPFAHSERLRRAAPLPIRAYSASLRDRGDESSLAQRSQALDTSIPLHYRRPPRKRPMGS